MSGLTVDPFLLLPAADKALAVSQNLTGVARALRAVAEPDTGRPDGVRLSERVIAELAADAVVLARDAARDAYALRTAGATYAVVEARIAGEAACS